MNEAKETFYFLSPKSGECSVTGETCTGTRSRQLCSFHKTEKEYFEDRNRAVMINRTTGRCGRCKYKSKPCELIEIGGDNK